MNESASPQKIPLCTEFIRFLAMSLANASLYSPRHPQVARLCSKAFEILLQALGREPKVAFLLIDEQIIVDNQPLPRGVYSERVLRVFQDKKIEHVEFSAKVTENDLLQLIANLLSPETAHQNLSPNEHIHLGQIAMSGQRGEAGTGQNNGQDQPAAQRPEDLPKNEFDVFTDICEKAKKHQGFSLSGLSEMVSGLIRMLRDDMNSFLFLSALQQKDSYTFTHSTNVCILNLAQAVSLNIQGRMLHDIGVAGMLHDMGKLFIPEEILCKPGKLDDDEMALMRQHPVRGAEYLYGIHNIPPLAVSTAYEHHIDFGGGGYPRVPADWSLNLCSYLTSISDIFDALRTKRSYQLPTELSECKKILLKLSGTKLHPALTRHFLTLVDSVALKIPAASRS